MKTLVHICILVVVAVAHLAHGDERTICTLTMPTNNTSISTAANSGCVWGPARTLMLQCDNPVYYSSVPDGLANSTQQKTVRAAVSTDPMIDFDINPDPYRIDLRAGSQHISVQSVSTAANTCRVGSVSRLVP